MMDLLKIAEVKNGNILVCVKNTSVGAIFDIF